MEIKKAIELKVVSCGIETTYQPKRQASATLYPDARISIGNEGTITNQGAGLQIVITCRHNGSVNDILEAFEDAKKLIANSLA